MLNPCHRLDSLAYVDSTFLCSAMSGWKCRWVVTPCDLGEGEKTGAATLLVSSSQALGKLPPGSCSPTMPWHFWWDGCVQSHAIVILNEEGGASLFSLKISFLRRLWLQEALRLEIQGVDGRLTLSSEMQNRLAFHRPGEHARLVTSVRHMMIVAGV